MNSLCLAPIFHRLIMAFYRGQYLSFKRELLSLEKVQRRKLKGLLAQASQTVWGRDHGLTSALDYEEMVKKVPIQNYDTLSRFVLEQKETRKAVVTYDCERYQPTSGSTNQRKWIPYNPQLLKEFDAAIGPWLYDLYQTYPEVLKGKHYWSLSWLPQNLRHEMVDNDDLNYFPWYKRLILKYTMAVPSNIQNTPTLESSRFITLLSLVNTRDLTMIFIWSPTYFFTLIEELIHYQKDLAQSLSTGAFTLFQEELKGFKCPQNSEAARLLETNDTAVDLVLALWPKLSVLSCWETAEAHFWTKKIKKLFPALNIQGKGLVATEGMVTIPFAGQYLLSYRSHFYEFMDLETKIIVPAWELKVGQQVKPILSTGNGFWRYALEDHLLVEAHHQGCPVLKFMGRLGGVDLVGEKISREIAQALLDQVEKNYSDIIPVTLIGVQKKGSQEKSGYVLLLEGEKVELKLTMEQKMEAWLMESHHYHVARDLKQLLPLQVVIAPDGLAFYRDLMLQKGLMEGDIKVESLIRLDEWHE